MSMIPSKTDSESDWVLFESRDDSASAAILRSQLEHEGVETRLQVHGVPGLSTFHVLVPAAMLYRARRNFQQQPCSDAELEILATSLPPDGQAGE
jgi:hypothetical protein